VTDNVIVHAHPGEHSERLIRRFIKKVKRDGILERYRERCSYHIKPSVKRKIKQKKARRELLRLERKRNKRK
jgi:ribosomal protein S21